MSTHVTVIDPVRHKRFLHEQRLDPVTKEPFKVGDRVVICAADRSAFLEDSWNAIGSRHCNQGDTLPGIPEPEEPRPIGHRPQPADEPAPEVDDVFETAAHEPGDEEVGRDEFWTERPRQEEPLAGEYQATEPANAGTAAGAPAAMRARINLREIPITLKEIPNRLRDIAEL